MYVINSISMLLLGLFKACWVSWVLRLLGPVLEEPVLMAAAFFLVLIVRYWARLDSISQLRSHSSTMLSAGLLWQFSRVCPSCLQHPSRKPHHSQLLWLSALSWHSQPALQMWAWNTTGTKSSLSLTSHLTWNHSPDLSMSKHKGDWLPTNKRR